MSETPMSNLARLQVEQIIAAANTLLDEAYPVSSYR